MYSIGTDKDLIHRVYDNIKAAVAWANEVATKELRLRESEDARAEYAADSARENYLENYAELNSFLSELD